jgi:hypothetical protein
MKITRKRGRPKKYENSNPNLTNVAHTISSSSVQNLGDNSQQSDNCDSLIMDDEEDDYTGFDDFSMEEREQLIKVAQANKEMRRLKQS